MKGVVCAGGLGSRLGNLVKGVGGKHEVRVGMRKMVDYPVETLKKLGCTDILVISSRAQGGSLFQYLGSGRDYGVRFNFAMQEEADGIAGALSLSRTFVGSDPFIMILGDNIYEIDGFNKDIRKKIKDFKEGALVFLKEVEDPERFGVANIKDGKISKVVEKPKRPKSNLAITGLYCYDSTVFSKIDNLTPSARGELEITDVNEFYLKEGKLDHVVFPLFWGDAGTPKSLMLCDEYFRNKEDE